MSTKAKKVVRCAIYTRKSTSDGLEQAHNSLDAQRDTCEQYIRHREALGWQLVTTRYDDGGFTGGNMERPALARLLEDVRDGRVDAIVVYKVDRLSRSLLDFANMLKLFDEVDVGLVSVTQQFDTMTSMGRLTLHILLSFAQFEREIISERTRDKIQSSRRKGKWTGGPVPLGYALDSAAHRLVVVEDEAKLVRATFALYLQHRSTLQVARILNSSGYFTKSTATRPGHKWDKQAVSRVLRTRLYTGEIGYKGEWFPGEHAAIITIEQFKQVNELLGQAQPHQLVETTAALPGTWLLKGLVVCAGCGFGMVPTSGARGQSRGYRCGGRARGRNDKCPTTTLPAEHLDKLVVERLRTAVVTEKLVEQTVARAQELVSEKLAPLAAEIATLRTKKDALHQQGAELLETVRQGGNRAGFVGQALNEIDAELVRVDEELVSKESEYEAQARTAKNTAKMEEVARAFVPVWNELGDAERRRVVEMWVKKVRVDLANNRIDITFHDGLVTSRPSAEVAA